jgi:TetR/AcrR family transcriptional regulator, transcriptional repressor for nem operon
MANYTQKQINKENLLNQGVSLLMQQGYHGTGLKEILDAVGIPKGSFYNYFGSKENFGAEVIQHYIEPFIEQLNNHLQNPYIDALTALQRYFNESILELEKTDFKGGCLLGNLMGELGDSNEVCRIALQASLQRYRNLLAMGLARAQEEGKVRTDKSATELADLLLNTWQGALLRMKIDKSSVLLRQCCQELLNDFFKA